MKARYAVAIAVLLVAALTVSVIVTWGGAAERPPQAPAHEGMMGGGGMGRGGMMGERGGMMGMGGGCAMSGMMGRGSMVATGDYIYVLAGQRLIRFDRNLKLINEVEIMPAPESMHRMMESCPMMQGGGGMMGGGGRMGGGGAPAPPHHPAK